MCDSHVDAQCQTVLMLQAGECAPVFAAPTTQDLNNVYASWTVHLYLPENVNLTLAETEWAGLDALDFVKTELGVAANVYHQRSDVSGVPLSLHVHLDVFFPTGTSYQLIGNHFQTVSADLYTLTATDSNSTYLYPVLSALGATSAYMTYNDYQESSYGSEPNWAGIVDWSFADYLSAAAWITGRVCC